MNEFPMRSFAAHLILFLSLAAAVNGCEETARNNDSTPGTQVIRTGRLYPLGHAQENILDSPKGKTIRPKESKGDMTPPLSQKRRLELDLYYKMLMKECDVAYEKDYGVLLTTSNVVLLGQGRLEDFQTLDLRTIAKWRRGPISLKDATGSVFLVRSYDTKWLLLEIVEQSDDSVAIRWIRQPSGEALFVDDLTLLKEASPQLRLGIAAKSDHELLYRLVQQPIEGDNGKAILKEIEVLLDKGIDANQIQESAKFNPLHGAALAGQLPATQLLLKRGADVNAQSSEGWTALHIAAKLGHLHIVEELLAKGADSLQQTPKRETARDLAKQVKPPNAQVIEMLERHMFKS